MKQIIVVKPGSISPDDKASLKENGCVIIETANPQDIRVIHQLEGFEGDGLFQVFVKTLQENCSMSASTAFVKNMTAFLSNKEKK